MATIATIKQSTNSRIRVKTNPNSVTTSDVADNIDLISDEVRSRGFLLAATTAGLAAFAGSNSRFAMVTEFGFFEYSPSGVPNGTTIFAAQGTGTWNLVASFAENLTFKTTVSTNYTYSLDAALQIDEIKIKPSIDQTIKIGFTAGAEDVLMEELIPAGTRKSIQQKIFGDENPSIYFSGITADVEITIYRKRL